MTGLILASGLALAALGFAALVFRLPRHAWQVLAAALLLGLAGYAMQGRPALSGAPRQPNPQDDHGSGLVAAQRQLARTEPTGSNAFVTIANGFIRNGQFGDAAGILLGAVHKDPADSEAWLALANALVGHAEGNLSPAALYAYGRAAQAAPDHPGPPFFLGLALAQSGRLAEARKLWADLLARAPEDAPWRADLASRLAALDRFIAGQEVTTAPR